MNGFIYMQLLPKFACMDRRTNHSVTGLHWILVTWGLCAQADFGMQTSLVESEQRVSSSG